MLQEKWKITCFIVIIQVVSIENKLENGRNSPLTRLINQTDFLDQRKVSLNVEAIGATEARLPSVVEPGECKSKQGNGNATFGHVQKQVRSTSSGNNTRSSKLRNKVETKDGKFSIIGFLMGDDEDESDEKKRHGVGHEAEKSNLRDEEEYNEDEEDGGERGEEEEEEEEEEEQETEEEEGDGFGLNFLSSEEKPSRSKLKRYKNKPQLKKHHILKGKLKFKDFLFPLLLAYKLKFFTIIPLFVGSLVLLLGTTTMAGFFFALFSAALGLQSKSGHH